MSFLIDSDICSAHLRGERSVFSKFVQHTGRLHVSAITAGELYSWVLRSKAPPDRLQLLQRFLIGVTLLPVEYEVAYRFGLLRAGLLDRGQPTMGTDLFIAATALVHGLTLVTHNTRHFQNVPDLVVEDWLAP
jgi:tRNA(fMet)-specific endonuclease VapC